MGHNINFENIICTADRDQGDISTLAASIEQLGLLQPIVLKPQDGGKYEVVDGRRRFAALQKIGQKMLTENQYTFAPPAGDPAVMAHAANVERKNLTPAEEVRQLAQLAEKHSVEHLATLFGRTPGYIARRLKIATLIPTWLKALDDPELAAVWTLDKLALIARQSETVQGELSWLITADRKISLEYLQDKIKSANRSLREAYFDLGECSKCKDNSATQELLFDDADQQAGSCMNNDCWIKKSIAYCRKILNEEKLIPIKGNCSGWNTPDTKFADKLKAEYTNDYKKVRDPKKGESANAIIVSGEGIGRKVFAEAWPKEKKTVNRGAAVPAEERKPKSLKERETELAQKRNKRALQHLLEYITKDYDTTAWIAKIPEAEKLADLMLVLYLYGCDGKYTMSFRVDLKPGDVLELGHTTVNPAGVEAVRKQAYQMALYNIRIHLKAESEETLAAMSMDAGPAIAKLLRIDDSWEDAKTQSVIDVPEPKSLTEARAKAGRK